MRQLICISALFLLAGCRTTKTATTSTTVHTDSVRTAKKDSVSSFVAVKNTTVKRDTVIQIPGGTVQNSFAAADLAPVVNSTTGERVPQTYVKRHKHLTSTVTIDTNGNVLVDCTADSLAAVIATMTEVYRDSIDYLLKHTENHSQKATATLTNYTQFVERSAHWLARYKWYIILLVVAIFITELVRKIGKYLNHNKQS